MRALVVAFLLALEHRLNSCGAQAQLHVGSSPEPGIQLMSPALAGGFFTTEPPGKPLVLMALDSTFDPDKPQTQSIP